MYIRNILYATFLLIGSSLFSQTLTKENLSALKFRHVGPMGNRSISVAGVADNPNIYYVGSASGGIFKSVDGGFEWKPIFDDQSVHAIGALAVAPSDTEIVYVGTGEAFIRSNVSIGNGMYRSMDGGDTWQHLGLDNTGRISRIVVHPTNPDIVYVAAVGHGYSPQKERGIYRTLNGGKTWEHVLFVDENTGGADIVMDPSNPRILFAGMWQLDLKTWHRMSGGKGSGIYMSTDAGKTWKKLTKGLPKIMGKSSLAMSPDNPNRVYALIETGDGVPFKGEKTESGELWRSDDKGKSWKLINSNRDLGGRQAYYTRCAVAPDNANEVYFIAAAFSTSIDGGKSISSPRFLKGPNWDHHEMWIDPNNPDRQIVVGDGGVSITQNRGKSWLRKRLPNAQLYHVTTDTNVPYNVLTNRQDGPSMKGPSRSNVNGFGNGIPNGMWHAVGGGESGFATSDPKNPDIIWNSASGSGAGGGIVTYMNEKNGHVRKVEVWPERITGHAAKDVKYRFQWTFPLLISPHDNNTVYVTSQHVHRTTDKGNSWEVISPDLTLNDKSKQQSSGGLTGDNINVEYMNVIYAFDESPVQKGVFWAGTNDGLIHVSKDGGKTWENVSKNIKGLPELGVVRNIDASQWDAGKAYVTIEFHQVGNFKPYVYKTDNYGKTWTKITNGIDDSILSYTRNIKEDPTRKGLLYLGTENKLYVSFDDGANWQSMMGNLPPTPIYWIDIQEDFNDLVIATYGRGIWILDDLTPIQKMSDAITKSKMHLFKPHDTYRLIPKEMVIQFFPAPHWGTDPPSGAPINYWLTKDAKDVKLIITNKAGDTIRTIKTKGKAGLNRTYWNLKSDPTEKISMRTKAQYAEWMPLGDKRMRRGTIGPLSIQLPPDEYTVTLKVGDETQTQKLTVKKDPNSEGTLADINKQYALLKKLHTDMGEVAEMINESENVRRQLYDLKDFVKDKKDVMAAIKKLDSSVIDLEGKLIQLKRTGTGQDDVRFPSRLASRINYLAGAVAGTDYAPTKQQYEVYDVLKGRLDKCKTQFEKIKTDEIPAFRDLLTKNGVQSIIMKE